MKGEANWVKQIPTESGFYWYRENFPEGRWNVRVMEWDSELGQGETNGNDIPWLPSSAGWGLEIDGEFWSQPLTPPAL